MGYIQVPVSIRHQCLYCALVHETCNTCIHWKALIRAVVTHFGWALILPSRRHDTPGSLDRQLSSINLTWASGMGSVVGVADVHWSDQNTISAAASLEKRIASFAKPSEWIARDEPSRRHEKEATAND